MLLCYRINRARHWALLSSRPALARPAAATFSSIPSTAANAGGGLFNAASGKDRVGLFGAIRHLNT
jgi:hypothetical protein